MSSAFRVRKYVALCDSESLIVGARCCLKSIKRACLGISRSVYRAGLMSLLWVRSGEIAVGSEPGTIIHPMVLRTCHPSANFFFFLDASCDLGSGGPPRPVQTQRRPLFPSGGLCSHHQFQMTPADDIVSYSPNHRCTETGGCQG